VTENDYDDDKEISLIVCVQVDRFQVHADVWTRLGVDPLQSLGGPNPHAEVTCRRRGGVGFSYAI